jgi:hypothetical protein
MKYPFRYFNSSSEIIRLTVMMYIRYPLSLRQVDDLLFARSMLTQSNLARLVVSLVPRQSFWTSALDARMSCHGTSLVLSGSSR